MVDSYSNPITIEVYESGRKGDKGDTGATGLQGAPGINGKDGSVWHTGSVNPLSSLGKDTDMFLNSVTGDIFQRQSGTWTFIINVLGH